MWFIAWIVKVGFSAGDGRYGYSVSTADSGGASMDLAEDSNVRSPGRYVFRVDLPEILDPACSSRGTSSELFSAIQQNLHIKKSRSPNVSLRIHTKDLILKYIQGGSESHCLQHHQKYYIVVILNGRTFFSFLSKSYVIIDLGLGVSTRIIFQTQCIFPKSATF